MKVMALALYSLTNLREYNSLNMSSKHILGMYMALMCISLIFLATNQYKQPLLVTHQ